METLLPPEVWTQIGIGAVFLFLFLYFAREWKSEREAKDVRILEKDKQILALNQDLLSAYIESTKASMEVKAAVENNTQALRSVIDRLCKP